MKTRQNVCDTPSAILSQKGIARYGGYLSLVLWRLASVLDSRALKPSCNFLRFPAMCPPKTVFFCGKVHLSAGKCIFRYESDFFGRKMHFSAGKPIFLQFTPKGWESWMVVCFVSGWTGPLRPCFGKAARHPSSTSCQRCGNDVACCSRLWVHIKGL